MELLASRLFLFAPAFLDLQAFQSFGTLELNPMQAPSSLAIADVSSPDHGDSADSIAYFFATQTKCQLQMLSLQISDSHWKENMHKTTDSLCGI